MGIVMPDKADKADKADSDMEHAVKEYSLPRRSVAVSTALSLKILTYERMTVGIYILASDRSFENRENISTTLSRR